MLRQVKELNGYKLGARDGEIGHAREFYFEDVNWTDPLSGRRYRQLAHQSPGSDFALCAGPGSRRMTKIIPVELTKKQIEHAPSLDS